jgi:prephenate dehydratase
MMLVAYQGNRGAFSDVAARTFFPDGTTRGYPSFDAAAAALDEGAADYVVLPIEDAIAGPIPRIYEILWERPALRIQAEMVLPVELCLIGVDGASIAGIGEIRSHPVALDQVRRLFEAHPEWKRTTTTDTAGAVAEVVALGDPAVAAIGPALAAEIYGATILERAVQDEQQNATRFFLIGRGEDGARTGDRACVGLALEDRPGSLRDALGSFADRGIDLRMLIARPDRRQPFRYRFFCELGTVDDARLDSALAAIGGEARILGRY